MPPAPYNPFLPTAAAAVPRHARSDEIELLIRPALELVLAWIKKGEREDGKVMRWPTVTDARREIELPKLADGATLTSGLRSSALVETILENSVNPWTGRFLDKLYSAPKPIGLVADLLLSVLNANCHVFSASPVLTLAEEMCVQELGRLCGWYKETDESEHRTQLLESQFDGLTMPGGSAANTLALQTALAVMFPSYKEDGIPGAISDIVHGEARTPRRKLGPSMFNTRTARPVILTSEQSHYSLDKAALACGLGTKSVIKVPCDASGRMDPAALRRIVQTQRAGKEYYPFFVNATAGTTVMGSFDNLREIGQVCEEHQLWLHVDGSWGGPVLFSDKWKHLMDGLELAHSLVINPHKLLNAPLQCSFLLLKEGKWWLQCNALEASYLYHSDKMRDNPGIKTAGCGRRGDALKLYLLWLRYGRTGLGAHVDRGFELARKTLAMVRAAAPRLELYPPPETPFLQVCFRPALPAGFPDSSGALQSKAVVAVREALHAERMFAVDFATLPGASGQYLRLVTHPDTREDDLRALVDRVAVLGEEFFEARAR